MYEWISSTALEDASGVLPEMTGNSLRLYPEPHMTKLKLQCRPNAEVGKWEFEQALGSKMPVTPDGVTGVEPGVFWLGPNEWLITSSGIKAPPHWCEKLKEGVSDQIHAVNDLSDSMVVIKVQGKNSNALLVESCGIDLHPEKFFTGRYATTRLFGLFAIIHCISEEPAFRLYIDRSTALHLWHWLADGVRQFGQH